MGMDDNCKLDLALLKHFDTSASVSQWTPKQELSVERKQTRLRLGAIKALVP